MFNQKFSKDDILGNILGDFPNLWKAICLSVISCQISERLNQICDCEYEKTNEIVKQSEIEKPDCG